MLSPPVSAKSIRIPIKHLPQTNTATTGFAVELVLTSQHRPGQSSAFNYFSVSGFCIPACSLCRSFLCLLVFGSIWTAKWSFAPSFAKSAAAEGCGTAAAADGSKQPNAAEALAPPSQPGLFLALSVWVVFFFKEIWSWMTSVFRSTIQAPGTGQTDVEGYQDKRPKQHKFKICYSRHNMYFNCFWLRTKFWDWFCLIQKFLDILLFYFFPFCFFFSL